MESNIDFSKLKPVRLGGGGFLRGAHHPHCDRHYNHLLWFFGHPLCLGCTCMYSGIFFGIPFALLVQWSSITFIHWLFFHLFLLIPTFLQPWIQKKLFKMVARFLLGISISSYLISGLFLIEPPIFIWIFRVLIVIFFALTHRLLLFVRNRYTYSPCDDCPLGTFPTCDWNLPRLLAENPDIDLFATIKAGLENSSNQ